MQGSRLLDAGSADVPSAEAVKNAGLGPATNYTFRASRSMRTGTSALPASSGLILHSSIEPSLGRAPIASHRHDRNLEHFGRLFQIEATKVTQLYDSTLARVELRQFIQRFVHRYQLTRALLGHRFGFCQRNPLDVPAMLNVMPSPRVIDQDVPHDLGGKREEVRPILPVNLLLSGQTQIRFVNQRGG